MSRESAARHFAVATAALSASAAALVGLALLAGTSPLDAVRALAEGAAGSNAALGETLTRATALVLTAVGASLAFRAGVLNIGLEGQFLAGAVAAAAVGPLLAGSPLAARAGLLAAAALAGALWVLPAAYLEARRGVPEVLSTILLNLVAAAAVSGLVRGALQDPGGDYPQSRALPDVVRLAPLAAGSRVTAAILVALALALFVTLLLEKTPFGLKLRATGLAPAAARAIGLPHARLRLLAFTASGALAGIAGGLEVLAVTGRLYDPFTAGAGYTGIAAALLGGSHPLAAAVSAVFFAALGAGSSAMQRDTGVPGALATIVPGVLVLAVLAARARLARKAA
ncbi:MAG TPA: ABC transporter permease [Thermoanaerobaculia bacterium]|nr:ABC transporter permease [Thermoanaerobaculia bacterium]